MDASIFQISKAKSLLNEPNSALALVTRTKHITLPPCYMGRLRTGVKDILNTDLKKYSELLGGVLIAYENILLVQQYGQIHSDEPYLHFDIQADFLIFQPRIGDTLKGVVNRLSSNHVGCLVHNCFNASLPRPASLEGDWLGDSIVMKQEVFFQVTHLDLSSHVIFIRGAILSVGEKPAPSLSVDDVVTTFIDNALDSHPLVNGLAIDEDISADVGQSRKRKSNVTFDITPPEISERKRIKLSVDHSDGAPASSSDSSSSVKKVKKKKRDRDKSDSSSPDKKKKKFDSGGSESAGQSPKKHKKHKKFKKHKDKKESKEKHSVTDKHKDKKESKEKHSDTDKHKKKDKSKKKKKKKDKKSDSD